MRFIFLSMSASATQFNVFAPPAASIPPTNVLRISSGLTLPRWASNIAGIAVTSNSSMTRGLVSAKYASNIVLTRLGATRSRMLTQGLLGSQQRAASTTHDGRPDDLPSMHRRAY